MSSREYTIIPEIWYYDMWCSLKLIPTNTPQKTIVLEEGVFPTFNKDGYISPMNKLKMSIKFLSKVVTSHLGTSDTIIPEKQIHSFLYEMLFHSASDKLHSMLLLTPQNTIVARLRMNSDGYYLNFTMFDCVISTKDIQPINIHKELDRLKI